MTATDTDSGPTSDETAIKKHPPEFNPKHILKLYVENKHDDIADIFINQLAFYGKVVIQGIDDKVYQNVTEFISTFLHVISMEDFVCSARKLSYILHYNPLIANLTALTPFKTTEPFLTMVLSQKNNFMKILTLWNSYCELDIDASKLFKISPVATSHWYYSYLRNHRIGSTTPVSFQNLKNLLRYDYPEMRPLQFSLSSAYFGVTYIDQTQERRIKNMINSATQEMAAGLPIINHHSRERCIALLSHNFFKGHSVRKCMYEFIKRLAADYTIDLIEIGQHNDLVDPSIFRNIKQFQMHQMPPDLSVFQDHDYEILYYPDIGMNNESIICSNIRIAPIQIASYGHPVSTYDSEIDYWIGGAAVESIEDAADNYGERLVLIPGAGIVPERRQFTPPERVPRAPDETMIINCVWTSQKITVPLIECLRDIIAGSNRRIEFRVFPGMVLDNGFMRLKMALGDALGAENVNVIGRTPPERFMEMLAEGDLTIDSHPFGGYTTTVDSVCAGVPFIAWQGTKFYNRTGAWVLNSLDLGAYIAHSRDQFVDMVVRLANDPDALRAAREKVRAADLESGLFDVEAETEAFVRAIDYLRENHERLREDPNREPILIS